MFWQKRVHVAPYQRGLKFVDQQLVQVLAPGEHRWLDLRGRTRVELVDLTQPEVRFERADAWLRTCPDLLGELIEVVDLEPRELGVLHVAGKFAGVLPAGSRTLFWRGLLAVHIERIDLQRTLAIDEALLRVMLAVPTGSEAGKQIASTTVFKEVPQHAVGLLSVDGQLVQTLQPGLCGWWKSQRTVSVEVVDLRQLGVEVSGQEILTRDKVSLRANLTALYRVVDAVQAKTVVKDFAEALYRELQFGLRQAIGTRTLDQLLAGKSELDQAVVDYATPKLNAFGIQLVSAGVKDLILPGEIREILNQVVQAEKVALAQVIRRREETAATRSQLNTAKLIEESPALMRLKELEALEKITEKVRELNVYGGLDGVLKQLSPLKG